MEEPRFDEEEKSEKKTCFVTGGSGFLGYNLLLELLNQDWHIIVFYYSGDKDFVLKRLFDLKEENPDDLELVEGNVLKVDSIKNAMPEEIDCVFHLAGSIVLDSRMNHFQTAINVDGTRNVLDVAIEKKAKRFIHTSSTSVYGENAEDKLINEDSYKGAMEYSLNYGQSKFLGEKLVLEASKNELIDVVVMQPNFILGEHDIVGQGFSLVYNKVRLGKIPVCPPGGGSFGDAREIARSFVSAYENGRSGECYLLGGVHLSQKDFIELIAKEMKVEKYPKFVSPKWLFYYIACLIECSSTCLGKSPKVTTQQAISTSRMVRIDSTKAEKELGFKATPIKELVRRQIKYMEDHGLFEKLIVY